MYQIQSATWDYLTEPNLGKANLLIPGYGQDTCSVYFRAQQGVWVAKAKRTQTPERVSGKGF